MPTTRRCGVVASMIVLPAYRPCDRSRNSVAGLPTADGGQEPQLIAVVQRRLETAGLSDIRAIDEHAYPHAAVVPEDPRLQPGLPSDTIQQSVPHRSALALHAGRPTGTCDPYRQSDDRFRHGNPSAKPASARPQPDTEAFSSLVSRTSTASTCGFWQKATHCGEPSQRSHLMATLRSGCSRMTPCGQTS